MGLNRQLVVVTRTKNGALEIELGHLQLAFLVDRHGRDEFFISVDAVQTRGLLGQVHHQATGFEQVLGREVA